MDELFFEKYTYGQISGVRWYFRPSLYSILSQSLHKASIRHFIYRKLHPNIIITYFSVMTGLDEQFRENLLKVAFSREKNTVFS